MRDARSCSGPLHGATRRIPAAQHVGAGEMGPLEAGFGHRGRIGHLFLPELVDELAQDLVVRRIATDASRGAVEDAPGTLVVAVAVALDRLLSCPSGEQAADSAVDVADRAAGRRSPGRRRSSRSAAGVRSRRHRRVRTRRRDRSAPRWRPFPGRCRRTGMTAAGRPRRPVPSRGRRARRSSGCHGPGSGTG